LRAAVGPHLNSRRFHYDLLKSYCAFPQ
jgi:hypothetical protein